MWMPVFSGGIGKEYWGWEEFGGGGGLRCYDLESERWIENEEIGEKSEELLFSAVLLLPVRVHVVSVEGKCVIIIHARD